MSSTFTRTSLLEDYGCSPEQVLTVDSGCNMAVPPSPPVRDRPVRNILFLGYEWERKGGPMVLRAVQRLQRHHRDVRLTVAGCSPKIDAAGVSVLGRVAPAHVPALLLDADVLCMPSWVEPSAGVYLEASAYALPVVATDVGGTAERVPHEVAGLLGSAGDEDAVHENLRRPMVDADLAHAYGRAGYDLERSSFTWPVVAGRIAAAIRDVVAFPAPTA